MKFKRTLCLLLVYVLVLITLPMNLIVEQVNAEGLNFGKIEETGIINYNMNYSIKNFFIYDIQRDNNSLILLVDDSSNYGDKELIVLNEDGSSKIILSNMSRQYDQYLGVKNGKAYYLRAINGIDNSSISDIGGIYSIDLNDGSQEKLYNVKRPDGYGLTNNHIGTNSVIKDDGTIVLDFYQSPLSSTNNYKFNPCLLEFKDGKQRVIELKEKGISDFKSFTCDKQGNLWLDSIETKQLFKIDNNNNLTTYKVDLEEYSVLQNILIDGQGNIWAGVSKYDNASNKVTSAMVKLSQSGDVFTRKLYKLDVAISSVPKFTTDKDGQVWIIDGNLVKKFTNDTFEVKYKFDSILINLLGVVDENQLVVAEQISKYLYVNNKATIIEATEILGPDLEIKDSTVGFISESTTSKAALPQTGSSNDMFSLISLGSIMMLTGFVLISRKKVKVR